MTATIETIITCDGGDDCQTHEPYGVGISTNMNAKTQRERYYLDGWVYRKGKDYCAGCASRLGYVKTKTTADFTEVKDK